MKNKKQQGQYMTPIYIVNMILDAIGFYGNTILDKKIMEPSFGNGIFLQEVVKRIIAVNPKEKITEILNENIYGIEKDEILYKEAIQNLNNILNQNQLPSIEWKNLINGDTLLLYKNYIEKFDYVVGNPPYVNIHNIKEEYRDIIKEFKFTEGTIDLYVIFYEIGIQLLNDNGILGFITPNSFIFNKSQKKFRDYLIDKNLLKEIYNFKQSKIFEDAQTYTCICILDKKENKYLHYKEYKEKELLTEEIFSYKEFNYNPWILGKKEDVVFLNENKSKNKKIKDIAVIQNGISTNKDNVYIHKIYEDKNCSIPYMRKHSDNKKYVYFLEDKNIYKIESTILHRIVKESRFNGTIENTYIIYPYDYENGTLIKEDILKSDFPFCYEYLLLKKEELVNRDMDKNSEWYAFARSQGLRNMNNKKVVIKHLFNKNQKIIPYLLDEDIVIYSGMYTISDNLENIIEIYQSDDFRRYCILKGKEMQNEFIGLYSTTLIKEFGIN